MLQNRKANPSDEIVGDHASHPEYNRDVKKALLNIITKSEGNNQKAYNDIVNFVLDLKEQLELEVVKGNKIVNTLIIVQ